MDKKDKIKLYAICFLVLLNTLIWYVVYCEDRRGILTVSFLDVGQGDAIFIDAPNGNQVLLDGGPDKSVLRQLSSAMPFYDRSIDLVALSHPHSDHTIGLVDILFRYSVLGFISSGTKAKTPEYISLKKEVSDLNIKDIVARRGMKIDLGDGAIMDVLLPAEDVASSTPHDGMLVIKLNYGKTSFLFTGDMENGLENYLAMSDGKNLKSDVLKVGHHGSRNSTSELFLGLVSPEDAVISVGADNKYGHPANETINILGNFGAQIFRTDKDGSVTIESDGEKMIVN